MTTKTSFYQHTGTECGCQRTSSKKSVTTTASLWRPVLILGERPVPVILWEENIDGHFSSSRKSTWWVTATTKKKGHSKAVCASAQKHLHTLSACPKSRYHPPPESAWFPTVSELLLPDWQNYTASSERGKPKVGPGGGGGGGGRGGGGGKLLEWWLSLSSPDSDHRRIVT